MLRVHLIAVLALAAGASQLVTGCSNTKASVAAPSTAPQLPLVDPAKQVSGQIASLQSQIQSVQSSQSLSPSVKQSMVDQLTAQERVLQSAGSSTSRN